MAHRQSHHLDRLDRFFHVCRQAPSPLRPRPHSRPIPRRVHSCRLFPLPHIPAIRQRLCPVPNPRPDPAVQIRHCGVSDMAAGSAVQSTGVRRCVHARSIGGQVLSDHDDRRDLYAIAAGSTTGTNGHRRGRTWRPRRDILPPTT